MTDTAFTLLFASIGFTSVALLTWFFSTRRKLFIRTFVPAENIRDAIRALPKNSDFERSFRIIAILQFVVAGGFWTAFLFAWLA